MEVGFYTMRDVKNLIFNNCHKVGDYYVDSAQKWLFKIVEINGDHVHLLADFAWERPVDPNNPHFGITYCRFNELNGKYFIRVRK